MDLTIILLLLVPAANALPAADKACDCVCGVRDLHGRHRRMVGGKETQANEYPWMVGLYGGSRLFCGGAIIYNKHVLTAAHCVPSSRKDQIKVFLGGHNISTDYVEKRGIRRIYEHENYDPVSYDSDIALLELDQPVLFGLKIQPICLPQSQFDDYSGKAAIVTGWGVLGEGGPQPSVLHQAVVPVWSKEECYNSNYRKEGLTDNMMCAGFQDGGVDACSSDSGGPLHFEGETGSMEVIGIVSNGDICGLPKLPGISTRVSNYLPWIRKIIDGQCLCKPKEKVRSNIVEEMLKKLE